MRKITLTEEGRGLVGLFFWAALLGLLAWVAWQLYLHPESFNPKGAAHSAYEDTHPSNPQ